MANLTIRNLDEALKQGLRIRAAHRGHSMEEEVRQILRQALQQPPAGSLPERIRQRFASLDAESLPIPARRAARMRDYLSE